MITDSNHPELIINAGAGAIESVAMLEKTPPDPRVRRSGGVMKKVAFG